MWPFANRRPPTVAECMKTAGAGAALTGASAPVPLCEQGPKIVGARASVIAGASAPTDRRVNDTGRLYVCIVYRADGSKRTYDGSLDQVVDMARAHLSAGATRIELEPEWRSIKVPS